MLSDCNERHSDGRCIGFWALFLGLGRCEEKTIKRIQKYFVLCLARIMQNYSVSVHIFEIIKLQYYLRHSPEWLIVNEKK